MYKITVKSINKILLQNVEQYNLKFFKYIIYIFVYILNQKLFRFNFI